MKYLRKINENFKDDVNELINLRLIEDVKDMALEYIDEGYTLELKVEAIYSSLTHHDYSYTLYEYKFNHNKDYVIRYIDDFKFPDNYPNLRVEYEIQEPTI